MVCFAAGKKKVAESEPTDLQPGWNLLSLTIADHRRSFLVYGGETLKGKGYADKGYEKKGDDKKAADGKAIDKKGNEKKLKK